MGALLGGPDRDGARRCGRIRVATYRKDVLRTTSYALPNNRTTTLGGLFAKAAATHPGLSGVEYIRRGRVSLEARLAMADLAERSLDLQYYIWDADISGRFLAERLVRAAERGVRVRVLLDDISVTDRDTALANLSGHPNIEIRAFNPFRDRRRIGDLFFDFARVNRRPALPEYSYHVTLQNGAPIWTTETNGKTVVYDSEPETSWWRRFTVGFIGLLPIDSQLSPSPGGRGERVQR